MIPNRTWLLRARRQMCVNYQDLCGVTDADEKRKAAKMKNVFTPEQRKRLSDAKHNLSLAIDAINDIAGYPKGT